MKFREYAGTAGIIASIILIYIVAAIILEVFLAYPLLPPALFTIGFILGSAVFIEYVRIGYAHSSKTLTLSSGILALYFLFLAFLGNGSSAWIGLIIGSSVIFGITGAIFSVGLLKISKKAPQIKGSAIVMFISSLFFITFLGFIIGLILFVPAMILLSKNLFDNPSP